MAVDDIISLILVASILIALITFCAVVIKRYWIDKKSVTTGSQFVGEYLMMQYQNKDKKKAMQDVLYQKEEEEEQDDEKDDVNK